MLEDADGSILRQAHQRALNPSQRVVHRGELLGVLQVPRLSLNVPVVEGADDESLNHGAGHIPHTAFPGHHGNAGIAAHRDTCFRSLRFVRPDDHILITTPRGAYDFAVTSTRIVKPEDGHVLHRTPTRTLTLVTCYPFFYIGSAPKRFIVHAEQR
jgi:sortase A